MRNKARYGLIIGGVLLLLHTMAVLHVFYYVHTSRDGQRVMAYMLFLIIDAPTIWLGYLLEQSLGLLSGVTDWWYAQGHQGINLQATL